MDDLEDKMSDQELIYNTLMAEKEAEEEQLYQELALKLLMNRSAKIIQRAWRAFRERKKSKRKGKKGNEKRNQQSYLKLNLTVTFRQEGAAVTRTTENDLKISVYICFYSQK